MRVAQTVLTSVALMELLPRYSAAAAAAWICMASCTSHSQFSTLKVILWNNRGVATQAKQGVPALLQDNKCDTTVAEKRLTSTTFFSRTAVWQGVSTRLEVAVTSLTACTLSLTSFFSACDQ